MATPAPTDAQAPPPSLRDVLRGRRGAFLLALLLAEFGAAMQGIAYSTVLPVVAGDLGGFALFGATLAAGSVAAVLMLAFAGPILGRFRPGSVLLVATALYLVGAALAVFASGMVFVLAGTVVRGVAAGLIGGFGMGAIGALFDERERPRVFGLFALIWLVPSVAGPPLNAVITEWVGWRWALAWPAVLVVAARALMGAYVSVIPWERARVPVRAGAGIVVAAALALSSWGSATPTTPGRIAFAAGVVVAAVGIVVFVIRGSRAARRVLLAFGLLCAAFFGLYEVLSLTMIEGLGSSLLWASVAVTAALLAWSLAGLRPRPQARPDRGTVGPILVGAALVVVMLGLWAGGIPGIVLVVIGAGLAGLGMGAAYPLLSSEPFTVAASATEIGALIAFAETAATAWAVLLAGGLYSSLHGSGWAPAPALLVVFGVLSVVAAAAAVVAATRRHPGRAKES